jgi:SP family general alpha glucoside:H+ symporter-like MFS transporter
VGQILGLLLNGFLADRFGYRRTILSALASLCLFVFLPFYAVNVQMYLAGQVLCGIPWGIFQTLATTYAAEIMPVALRAYILSSVNMCWLIGQLCAVGVLRSQASSESEWAYRLPLALQWAFAVPIMIGVYFAPESPGMTLPKFIILSIIKSHIQIRLADSQRATWRSQKSPLTPYSSAQRRL